MNADAHQLELVKSVLRLPEEQLLAATEYLRRLEQSTLIGTRQFNQPSKKAWPHAPRHRLDDAGAYMVTTGTHGKAHVFNDAVRLDLLENELLATCQKYEWTLEAWAVFSNHYHFLAYSIQSLPRLREFLTELHANTTRELNQLDGCEGRKVWYNFWDKQLTFEKSYYSRLNYVHQNAVKHGLVREANQYPWCSAAWLERTATRAQVQTVYSFKIDQLKVSDDFEPMAVPHLNAQ